MKKIIEWFKQSNRWKHLLGGVALGLVSESFYGATLVGVSTASALEYKDYCYGTPWGWTDWALTVGGALVGRAITFALLNLL